MYWACMFYDKNFCIWSQEYLFDEIEDIKGTFSTIEVRLPELLGTLRIHPFLKDSPNHRKTWYAREEVPTACLNLRKLSGRWMIHFQRRRRRTCVKIYYLKVFVLIFIYAARTTLVLVHTFWCVYIYIDEFGRKKLNEYLCEKFLTISSEFVYESFHNDNLYVYLPASEDDR